MVKTYFYDTKVKQSSPYNIRDWVNNNNNANKLGLYWAKLSSNWNWKLILLHSRFVAQNWLNQLKCVNWVEQQHFWEISWWLAWQLLRLYLLSELTLVFTISNSNLKWLRYDQIAILQLATTLLQFLFYLYPT